MIRIFGLDPSFRWDDRGVAAERIKSPATTLREVRWRCKTHARQTSPSAEIKSARFAEDIPSFWGNYTLGCHPSESWDPSLIGLQ